MRKDTVEEIFFERQARPGDKRRQIGVGAIMLAEASCPVRQNCGIVCSMKLPNFDLAAAGCLDALAHIAQPIEMRRYSHHATILGTILPPSAPGLIAKALTEPLP
jgi:hypothetical protein